MKITNTSFTALVPAAERVIQLAGRKVVAIDRSWDPARGTPEFTANGIYTSRRWTEWTQGFQFGWGLLAFEGGGEKKLLEIGRAGTHRYMPAHLTHFGVHDHGFNTISTYGNLRRLMRAGRIKYDPWELNCCELAIKVSGAVQAARWTELAPADDGRAQGYIYSFNGPHSLFVDTLRTLRVLGLAHTLGHVLMGERDRRISLLQRLLTHALTTRRYNLYRGPHEQASEARRLRRRGPNNASIARDTYDLRGRTAHESIFNTNDGHYSCPSSQQGYSPFSTWTRGLAWALLGFAEQVEFLATLPEQEFTAAGMGKKSALLKEFTQAAKDTADFYIDHATAADGIPYWDTGAPNLHKLGDWQARAADPFNDHEPVDSSAAAIAAQGLLRLGHHLGKTGGGGERYTQAGLNVARTLFAEPYLATSAKHQGLILHSVYHRPNGWDAVAKGSKVPQGESSMWGDYHGLELAVYVQKATKGKQLTFFD